MFLTAFSITMLYDVYKVVNQHFKQNYKTYIFYINKQNVKVTSFVITKALVWFFKFYTKK